MLAPAVAFELPESPALGQPEPGPNRSWAIFASAR